MKLVLLALAALIPLTSNAEFVPGRVRTGAVAEMKVLAANSGIKNAKSIKLSAHVTDGVGGFTGYTLTVDGNPTNFAIRKVENTGCGRVTSTILADITTGENQVQLTITDYSQALCEIPVPYLWKAEFNVREISSGVESKAILGGNPEYLMLTL
jgi:hypothetical protein